MSRTPEGTARRLRSVRRWRQRFSRARRQEAGVATLAVVLVIPAVLVLVSTVAQFVVYYHAANLAAAAAQEAARAAQLADGSEAGARAHGEDFIAQAGPNLVLEPQVLVQRDAVAEVVTVEVRGRSPQLLPGLPSALYAQASGPLERFEAPP